jgi:hypothetical protein
VQVSLLGTLAVRDDAGAPIEPAGTRLRLLVARLALDARASGRRRCADQATPRCHW